MGNKNSDEKSIYSNKNPKKIDKNEYHVLKNDRVYNIKLIQEIKVDSKKYKIILSFLLNNKFLIYEACIEQNEELKTILEQFFDNLSVTLTEKNLEIIHPTSNEEFIILKININNKIYSIQLFPSNINDINKYDELIKYNISLEKSFIQLNKKLKDNTLNNNLNNNQIFSDEEDNSNNDDNNSDNSFENNENINTITNYEKKDENHILLDTWSSIWCFLKLNIITYKENNIYLDLNLVAIGFSNGKIIIINLNSLKIYQEIMAPNTVYSLAQFENNPQYLICSLSNGLMIIYLLKENKYEDFQVLEKPEDLRHGEFNKVITLSGRKFSNCRKRCNINLEIKDRR